MARLEEGSLVLVPSVVVCLAIGKKFNIITQSVRQRASASC